jgi:hypothetical protein
VYFYADAATQPFMDTGTLEILITIVLFAINRCVAVCVAHSTAATFHSHTFAYLL